MIDRGAPSDLAATIMHSHWTQGQLQQTRMLLYMMAMSTVAIVDDDEAVRRALRRLFLSLSCQTTEFASGAAFLGALEETTPTCAFVDLHMPEMNGLDVLKRTRSEGYAFPVIIITGADSPHLRERCLLAGAAEYLVKPIERAMISAVIDGL